MKSHPHSASAPAEAFVLIATPEADLSNVPINHSPKFFVDEDAIKIGMSAFVRLALDYFASH